MSYNYPLKVIMIFIASVQHVLIKSNVSLLSLHSLLSHSSCWVIRRPYLFYFIFLFIFLRQLNLTSIRFCYFYFKIIISFINGIWKKKELRFILKRSWRHQSLLVTSINVVVVVVVVVVVIVVVVVVVIIIHSLISDIATWVITSRRW